MGSSWLLGSGDWSYATSSNCQLDAVRNPFECRPTVCLFFYRFPEGNWRRGKVLGHFFHTASLYEIWQEQNHPPPKKKKEKLERKETNWRLNLKGISIPRMGFVLITWTNCLFPSVVGTGYAHFAEILGNRKLNMIVIICNIVRRGKLHRG